MDAAALDPKVVTDEDLKEDVKTIYMEQQAKEAEELLRKAIMRHAEFLQKRHERTIMNKNIKKKRRKKEKMRKVSRKKNRS